jgi:hypothetical protein
MFDGLASTFGHKRCGSHLRVKLLTRIISDGWLRPSEIAYVRRPRPPSDIMLFPTPYLRRPDAVGDKQMPSDISYLRRFTAYVRRLWPSEVISFTVVPLISLNPHLTKQTLNSKYIILNIFIELFLMKNKIVKVVLV